MKKDYKFVIDLMAKRRNKTAQEIFNEILEQWADKNREEINILLDAFKIENLQI